MTTLLQLPDGRELELHEAGDPSGLPVIIHHGTPGSGLLYERWAMPGVRLIAYDRAGYGGSTRSLGRQIAAVVPDIEAIADELGLDRFATWGISGGGPHALACAALCGDRLAAAASLAGVAPWGAGGPRLARGHGRGQRQEFDLVLAGEEALRPAMERDRAELLALSAEELGASFDTLLGDADRAALTGELAAWLHANMIHGLERSADGWIDDDLAFVAAWEFDVGEISRPVLIVHGATTASSRSRTAGGSPAHMPGADAWIDDRNGHLTLVENRVREVHEWLLSRS